MNNPIITVRDMNLWYGQTQALKNINIDIPEKSITALIGPSGCGKSTFLKSLKKALLPLSAPPAVASQPSSKH